MSPVSCPFPYSFFFFSFPSQFDTSDHLPKKNYLFLSSPVVLLLLHLALLGSAQHLVFHCCSLWPVPWPPFFPECGNLMDSNIIENELELSVLLHQPSEWLGLALRGVSTSELCSQPKPFCFLLLISGCLSPREEFAESCWVLLQLCLPLACMARGNIPSPHTAWQCPPQHSGDHTECQTGSFFLKPSPTV